MSIDNLYVDVVVDGDDEALMIAYPCQISLRFMTLLAFVASAFCHL